MTTLFKRNRTIISCILGGCFLAASINGFTETAPQYPLANPQPNSMWTSMSKCFTLPPSENNAEVNRQIARLEKDPKSLNAMLQNAAAMISYVYSQTQKQGLPAELALLPLVESQYNPCAKSNAGASGLWQLMPGTAAGFGLKQNATYDGRQDIVVSTRAALRYLDDLHHKFNNWGLALAAYNWGPGNIAKLIKKLHGQSDLDNSKNLPVQTQEYVPKLLALVAIIKNPARYHIQLPVVTATPKLASVQVAPNVNLTKIAQQNDISVDDMRKLNPGYKNLATSSSTPNAVLIPAEKAKDINIHSASLATSI